MYDQVYQVFEEMLELNLLERLRPLVLNKHWDYAILWKLSDDHRCLELIDCICGGARNIEEITFLGAASSLPCRDTAFSHPRMKSCDLLDNVPSCMAMDSGVHGEALLSNHCKWLNLSSQGTPGARVLVPFSHVLIELLTAENVPKDERVMDFIRSQCSMLLEEQTDLSLLWGLSEWRKPLRTVEDKQEVKNNFHEDSTRSDYSEPINYDENEDMYRKRNGKGHQSKNLEAERKRRKKLNDKLYSLRSLVPNISKLDRTAILGDAVSYILELQKQVEDLQIELEKHSLADGAMTLIPNDDPQSGNGSCNDASKSSHELGGMDATAQEIEPQVEVFQMEERELFVKVLFEHKTGGFVKLLEALSSLGLQIINLNVTRHNYTVSNVFRVEKRENARIHADHVKKSLLNLA